MYGRVILNVGRNFSNVYFSPKQKFSQNLQVSLSGIGVGKKGNPKKKTENPDVNG
jgi:hypothetical protein